MSASPDSLQFLLTLPPPMARAFESLDGRKRPQWFACSDSAGPPLGSGGGTANLLIEAWRATGSDQTFSAWLNSNRKLMLHSGGMSRRLPAYAPIGKLLMPVPVLRWSRGQRLDQTLLDLALPEYTRVLNHAGSRAVAMLVSGDTLMRVGHTLPPLPDVDVVGLGMWGTPEKAKDHGVFFTPRHNPNELAFFLQKPAPARIRELAESHLYLFDTGMWLLSERAVNVLLQRCGWDATRSEFAGGRAANYEFYSGFGLALGQSPSVKDEAIHSLTCAVVPLPDATFHHFGTSAQMIESVSALQNLVLDETKLGLAGARRHPDQYLQNAKFNLSLRREENHTLWVENSVLPDSWRLAHEHVFTGVPENRWDLQLEPGVCLDLVPLSPSSSRREEAQTSSADQKERTDVRCYGERIGIRAYGFRDAFSGALGDEKTKWFGRPAHDWFKQRGLTMEECGLDPKTDIQFAPLFPVLPPGEIDPRFLEWLFTAHPSTAHAKDTSGGEASLPRPLRGGEGRGEGATSDSSKIPDSPLTLALSPSRGERESEMARFVKLWRELPRLSAQGLLEQADVNALHRRRTELRSSCLEPMMRNHRWSVFYNLDLESTAADFARQTTALPEINFTEPDEPMSLVRDQMFRAAVLRRRGESGWEKFEANAFGRLRELIVREAQIQPAQPRRDVLEDQIVWARSPARLDLAGGWTDTPPYCIEFGGKVVNLAADLNGQPPVQVFAKLCERSELVVRSIDLGVEERIRTYAELETYAQPGSAFALAKAAFALAGFLPQFHADGGFASLEQQLRDFGGGIELSLLAAVPKGSGLGTSSILSATVLAALSELCGLNWDRTVIYSRTLALEQMLTTGGGWQDQAGGLFRGIKLIETAPGLSQKPTLRWLPEHLFGHAFANRIILLYYTGVTRLAKNILAEIVRGIFLNSPSHLSLISDIGVNGETAAAAIQKCDYDLLAAAIRERWELTQRLDSGTNPPAIQSLLANVNDYLSAAKLLGAGGGGYLLMLAKDETAAARIRQTLTERPPNARARFVDFGLSDTGLQVTRS